MGRLYLNQPFSNWNPSMFFYESDISNPDMYFLKISFFWCPDIRFYRFSIHKTFQESMAELTDSAQYTIYLSILAHNSGSFTFSKLIHSPNNSTWMNFQQDCLISSSTKAQFRMPMSLKFSVDGLFSFGDCSKTVSKKGHRQKKRQAYRRPEPSFCSLYYVTRAVF